MFKVLGDLIILRPHNDSWKTKPSWKDEAGLNLPQKLEKGTVVGVGTGEWYQGSYKPIPVKEGDVVIYKVGDGYPVEWEGLTYIELWNGDIIGVIE